MKTYSDGTLTKSIRQSYSLYKTTHPLFKFWMESKHKTIPQIGIHQTLLEITKDKTSLWIDSFGYGLHKYDNNIISIEHDSHLSLLQNLPNVHFRKGFNDPMHLREWRRAFKPEIVVYFKSSFFKYLTVSELIDRILMHKKVFNSICIVLDPKFIQYNKLKYPLEHILTELRTQFPGSIVERKGLTELLINT